MSRCSDSGESRFRGGSGRGCAIGFTSVVVRSRLLRDGLRVLLFEKLSERKRKKVTKQNNRKHSCDLQKL